MDGWMDENFISVSEPYSLAKSHTNLGTQNNKILKSRIIDVMEIARGPYWATQNNIHYFV